MTIELTTPTVDALGATVDTLRSWQSDAQPLQLHPGDLGWFWRFGAEATAAAVRTWSLDGRIVAVGLLDGADVLRLTTAADHRQNQELAQGLLADVTDPGRGVLPRGRASVETPTGTLLHDLLGEVGWKPDAPWTPLRRSLAETVPDSGLRIEVVGPEQAERWTEVLRASFGGLAPGSGTVSTSAEDRWRAITSGVTYADAQSLLGYDAHGTAVATVTVWSAGPGAPGLIEPMGVHPEHRGHGYGTAITLAAAAALREMGSSSAEVCTVTANIGAVATYRASGMQALPERRDRYRDA